MRGKVNWMTLAAGALAAVLTFLTGEIQAGRVSFPGELAVFAPAAVLFLTILTRRLNEVSRDADGGSPTSESGQ